jgi:LPPG:FO 2-phospho-L-lactate transferase
VKTADVERGNREVSGPVLTLAGGFGGAKLAHGLLAALPRDSLSIVVNTADDFDLHGLRICPDLDTVVYTLAGLANPATGWGLRDETWSAAAMLARYGAPTWFNLGDGDLATHVLRTQRLRAGESLTEVMAALSSALGVTARVLPATDQPIRTEVRIETGWRDFQDYFVRRGHRDDVLEMRIAGIEAAHPTREVLEAIGRAALIVVAPSNPFVSIGTILAIPGMTDALLAAAAPIVAVSPIVAGAALRGPADRMFVTLGGEASAAGVARHYEQHHPGLLDGLVIDTRDAELAPAVAATGIRPEVADTVMLDDVSRQGLARAVLAFGAGLVPA